MTAEDFKKDIDKSLRAFASGSFTANGLKFFQTLGYVTERQSPLHKPTFKEFEDTYIDGKKFDETKAKASEWKYVDLLFQLSKKEVTHEMFGDFEGVKYEGDNKVIIETYLFFAIELSKEQYSRTELSLITREVNRLFPMPAMILFRHGNTLTLSVINRRLHKKDESKDVLEKVTQIKDINIGSPHRAHIEIMFDLSFDELKRKEHFSNFVELHIAWQKTLDIKELNKKFFNELANWYFWATQNVVFPDDAEKDKDLRNATGVIRLITRLMFVWFLKEKNLVPDDLFDEKKLKPLLKYSDKNKSSYYKAILQNLFFATLNTEMGSRRFRIKSKDEKQRDGHHFIHNVFRYEDEFVKPKETLEKYFANIPFLNGGLFECLDAEIEKPNNKKEKIRIDSFSDRDDNVLKVPDEIFFSAKEIIIDLSEVYGTPKKNKEKVRGLIDILSSYKFTIVENTPIDEEVALDPELLGKVFENLLANYNPETKTTARKQTGSFYTPREIVNYMVDESLIAYLKQQLNANENTEIKLRDLLSYSTNEVQFSLSEKEKLINAIDTIKIIDPACGSGAFPMGILHKLVHTLHKLDPKNELWKQRQLDKASSIDDASSREAATETIEEAFESNELDYGRKLYLIENCIYGVDIQPIAVQISKLRFFISLIVEQKTNPKKENLGIRPLPNLETKFVAANTLIELEKEKQDLFSNEELKKKKEKLKIVRHNYFEARTPKRKEKCREDDKKLREEMAEIIKDELIHFNKSIQQQIQQEETLMAMQKKELSKTTLKNEQRKKIEKDFKKKSDRVDELNSHLTDNKAIEQTAQKLSDWNPYNQNTSAPFFDIEWMFGLPEGFDIIIGNPPYIEFKKLPAEEKAKFSNFVSAKGKYDIYVIFDERANSLLKLNGVVCFIQPTTFMKKDFGEAIRNFIRQNFKIVTILDFADIQVFEGATNYTGVFLFSKSILPKNYKFDCHQYLNTGKSISITEFQNSLIDNTTSSIKNFLEIEDIELEKSEWNFQNDSTNILLEKFSVNTKPLSEITESIFQGIASGKDEVFYVNDDIIKEYKIERGILKKLLKGKDIKKYVIDWAGYYVIYPYDKNSQALSEATLKSEFPNAFAYLKECKELLKGRDYFDNSPKKWFELWNQRSFENFKVNRIISPEITDRNNFVLTNSFYGNTKTYHIIPKDKSTDHYLFLLGLLNSKLLDFIYKKITTPQAGGFYAYKTQFLSKLPIRAVNQHKPYAEIVSNILKLKEENPKADTSKFENQIDKMVYQLYELTEEQIKIVEGRK